MKKDVLFMCQFFYPDYVSSALLPYQTAQNLAAKGLKVGVLCGYPKEYRSDTGNIPKKEKINGVEIERKGYLQLGRKGFFSRLVNYFSFTFVMLLNVFKAKDYSIIIVYSNPPILPIVALLAKSFFGCQIVFVAYDLYPEIAVKSVALRSDSLIAKIMNSINDALYPKADQIVALSEDMKKFLLKNRILKEDQITIIPNWATEDYQAEKAIHSPQFRQIRQKHQLIVSYFGNMGTAQDIETLLSVMNDPRIKEASIAFLFAGHGNKKANLQQFVAEHNLQQVFIFDYLAGQDFNDALQISDLFVVSLAADLAGLAVPSKTYSYYQVQKPVLAIMEEQTDIAQEILHYQAGIWIANGQGEVLVDELLKLAEDPSKLMTFAANVTHLYQEKYRKEIQLQKYTDLIDRLLEDAKC